MNVVFLSTISRKAGGLFYSVRWLSKTLVEQGCSLQVVSPIDRFSHDDRVLWAPIPVRLYRGWGPMQTSLRMRYELTAAKADLFHVHGLWLDSQCAVRQQQKKRGAPVLISPRGMLDPWAVKNSAWKKKLVGALFANESLRKASCIHALCASEATSIRAYGLKNPIALIPNGVELPELGLPPSNSIGKNQLLFLGRIHPKKGLKELIEAWAKVKSQSNPRVSDWELIIAGWDDGGYESGLKQLATRLGVDESIDFIGPKFGAEKDLLLRSVDAFILPSYSEGLPMAVLEAWSYGLSVVMTDQCNLPEGFEAGAAIRVEPATGSISEGLVQLADMLQADRSAMGAQGRKLVERSYTWDGIASDMKAVYEWCLGGDKPPCILEA